MGGAVHLFGAACAGLLLLGGCTGEIFRTARLDENDSVFLDARQRAIINTDVAGAVPLQGQILPRRVICSEPSPDVALAVATSLTAQGAVFGRGSGALTASQAEGIAQLAARTATIQYLRDGLFQACQAYANGAINSTIYALLLSRLDETLVTTILGELAGGSFGNGTASIQTSADAVSSTRSGLAAGEIEANTKLLDLISQSEQRLAELEQREREATEAARKDPALKDQAEQAQKDVESEQAVRKTLTDAARHQASVLGGGKAKVAGSQSAGGTLTNPNSLAATEVRRIHSQFINDFHMDALMVACIHALELSDSKSGLAGVCTNILSSERLTAMLKLQNERVFTLAGHERATQHAEALSAIAKLCLSAATNEAKEACRTLSAAASSLPSAPEKPARTTVAPSR